MQRTMDSFVDVKREISSVKSNVDYGFVDFFCGIGGASEGARLAGLKVIIAVDSNERLLALHEANHRKTVHICTELPSQEGIHLPTDALWHLHGSPPCTSLSIANQGCSKERREDGLAMVQWFVSFAIKSAATTWSMEQVAVKPVKDLLDAAKRAHPDKVDYCVVDCATLGVPQNRKRLFAGTPFLISRLKRRRATPKVVCDFISNPRASHTRLESTTATVYRIENGIRKKVKKHYTWQQLCRPVTKACHTITAFNGLRWANPDTLEKPFRMNHHELKVLQTFPHDYLLKCSNTFGTLGVGNAVPPIAMRELLRPIGEGYFTPRVLASPDSPSFNPLLHSNVNVTTISSATAHA